MIKFLCWWWCLLTHTLLIRNYYFFYITFDLIERVAANKRYYVILCKISRIFSVWRQDVLFNNNREFYSKPEIFLIKSALERASFIKLFIIIIILFLTITHLLPKYLFLLIFVLLFLLINYYKYQQFVLFSDSKIICYQ